VIATPVALNKEMEKRIPTDIKKRPLNFKIEFQASTLSSIVATPVKGLV